MFSLLDIKQPASPQLKKRSTNPSERASERARSAAITVTMSGGDGSAVAIPAGTKKMVQSLKEIVDCTEQEIYATLKDCGMDPNEAVNRLILQDNFHEVKSKREKKEAKRTQESGSQKMNSYSNRGQMSSYSNRGPRGGIDRSGRNNTTYITSTDNAVPRAKQLPEKNETVANTAGTSFSNSRSGTRTDNSDQSFTPAVSNSNAVGNKVQATSQADGISLPPSQPSSTSQHNSSGTQGHPSLADIVKMGRSRGKQSTAVVATVASQKQVMSNTLHASKQQKQEVIASPPQTNQGLHSSEVVISKASCSSHEPVDVNTVSQDGDWSIVDQAPPEIGQARPENENRVSEKNVNGEGVSTDSITSASVVDDYGGSSCLDDGSIKNMSSAEDVSIELLKTTSGLQSLSLHEEKNVKPAVIIPGHLQVSSADCSHLCFGSFGSSISAPLSEAFTSTPMRNNYEVSSVRESQSPLDHLDTRGSEHYADKQLQPTLNENTSAAMSSEKYDVASVQQQEIRTDDTFNPTHRLQHDSPSISGYAYSGTEQPNAAANFYAHSNSEMHSLAPFSSAAAVKPGVVSIPQPSQQVVPSTSATTITALPQHPPAHPYSLPALPSGHFANMTGYPLPPPNFPYMPSAYQQAYSGISGLYQSPEALNTLGLKYPLPQFKNNISVNSLPRPAGIASGYGAASKLAGYEEAFASPYKDGRNLLHLRQNETTPLWLQGGGSRTVPPGAYYNQSGTRQSQLPSHYGAASYLNMYQSPPGVSREGNSSSSQSGQASQQSQSWQRQY